MLLTISACSESTPRYYNDYTDKKIYIWFLTVDHEYQANSIIKQLYKSDNKLQAFINLKKQYGKNPNAGGIWTDSTQLQPFLGNKVFKLDEGEFLTSPIQSSRGFEIVYMQKKVSKAEFSRMKSEYDAQTLNRIAAYETNYLNEFNQLVKESPKENSTYVQPANKKMPCKIWMGYQGDDKWFKNESFKFYWDGECKNGFASGVGREFSKGNLRDSWDLAIYDKGQPTYYITYDALSYTNFEGIARAGGKGGDYGVLTKISESKEDINVIILTGRHNTHKGPDLLVATSPFWGGTYKYAKLFWNFRYIYTNWTNNSSQADEFEFALQDGNGAKNGWVIGKSKTSNVPVSGEMVNNNFSQLNLPNTYNNHADEILKEIDDAKNMALKAQEQAWLVKKQYLKRICRQNVSVNFMDNAEYKEICGSKKHAELYARISAKVKQITEAEIARLEQQRYNAQQQKEEQHRQELLALEKRKLQEQQRHNRDSEAAASRAEFNRSMDSLNESIRSWTPKTHHVYIHQY